MTAKKDQHKKSSSVNKLLSLRHVGSHRPDGTEVKEGDEDAFNDAIQQAFVTIDRYAAMKMTNKHGGQYKCRKLAEKIRATLAWMERTARLGKGAFARMLEIGEDDEEEEIEAQGGEEEDRGQVEEEQEEAQEGEEDKRREGERQRRRRRRSNA